MNVLTDVIIQQTQKYGDREELSFINESGKKSRVYSWRRISDEVYDLACAFCSLGLQPTETVAIFSPNRAEFILTDFACYYNRAIPVSIYSTSSPEQVVYIVNDCKAKVICVGNQTQYDIVRGILKDCPTIEHILLYSPKIQPSPDDKISLTFKQALELGKNSPEDCRQQVEQSRVASAPDDVATFIYTSGTTGEPKGAMLTHRCFNKAMAIHRIRLTMLSDADTSLCFLPLSHIFEKAWTYYCMYTGMAVTINENPKIIADVIKMVRPTCMCSVPRFWEKVYAGINEKISSMTGMKKSMIKQAFKTGYDRNINYARLGEKAPWALERVYAMFDNLVFKTMRKAVGIENGNIFPTAGAPIAKHIVEFFKAMGVNMVVGYGLSETTATVTCFPPIGYVIGSVGTVMPELEVRIGENSEIQVKGETVMTGYHNKPEATAEAFTEDGWFRTGDAGYFDEQGALFLTERIKDLFKTSNGKYIAPQAIESRLGGDRYIEQVAVIGESRKYVTALIVPAINAIKDYAKKKGISYKSVDDLLHNPEIIKMITERIEKLQKGMPAYEQIKKFVLLPKAFTIESGELTNTLKVRRPVIMDHYTNEIESMYADA